jgi:NAD(P) transhydrogenase subunit alpha
VRETAEEVWDAADILVKVRAPEELGADGHEADRAHAGQVLVSLLFPSQNEELVQRLAEQQVTVFALDAVPRISRAQSMDVLSSMANIAGYRAVTEAATHYGSFFTGQHTAAGSVPPAKVLVIGAGVAGLAAVAAARALGAIVRAFDTRSAVREQVESLGGEFLEVLVEEAGDGGGGYAKVMSPEFIAAEMALFREQAAEVDIVITTALIPGKKAPLLWTTDMVQSMKPGSVVVDLAAEQGGNCELTVPGEVAHAHDCTILGYADLPSRMPRVASQLFGANVARFIEELGDAEGLTVDHDNEVIRGSLVVEKGELRWPPPPAPVPVPQSQPAAPAAPAPKAAEVEAPADPPPTRRLFPSLVVLGLAAGWAYLRFAMGGETLGPEASEFLQHFTVFILACFVGWQVIWNVSPALHTPLMSVTNAISGIIVVGGILQGGELGAGAAVVVGAAAVLFASINIFGGFLVTQRMLQMFRR